MFALPLAGRQRNVIRPPFWLQAASVSGFAMTVMFVVLSLFPIIDVPNPWTFTAKVGGFTLACQVAAMGLFYSHRRRKLASALAQIATSTQANVY